MAQRIIYEDADGNCCVVIPAPKALASGMTIEQIAFKDVPLGRTFTVVDESAIPSDRTYRNAWKANMVNRVVEHDMVKAKELHKNIIRQIREPLFAGLDMQSIRASEDGDQTKLNEVKATKQTLRDATLDPSIETATNIEELKQAWPSVLGENPLIKKDASLTVKRN